MRVKNDTCIKWSKLAETMFLTNEQFGALIRMVMIADDENQLRYKHLDDDSIRDLIECEKEWSEQFEVLKTANPIMRMCYASVYGQVSHSHEAFDKKQAEYDEKDNKEAEPPKKPKPKKEKKSEKPVFTVSEQQYEYELTSNIENEDNIPTAVDFLMIETKARDVCEMEDENIVHLIKTAIKAGNEDGWKHSIVEYAEDYYV